jgi:hypothetical protein
MSMMMDAFAEYLTDGYVLTTPAACETNVGNFGDNQTFAMCFNRHYKFTSNPQDFITSAEMAHFVHASRLILSATATCRELKDMGKN